MQHVSKRNMRIKYKNFTTKIYHSTCEIQVRFQVFTAPRMKIAIFWEVAPCSLVGIARRFRGACCLRHQGDE